MFDRFALRLFGPLALLCTISYAGPPAVTAVAPEGDSRAVVAAGQSFDLVAKIDPGDAGLAFDGLAVRLEASEGVETGAAILPPAPADGVFRAPFRVRLPVKLPGNAAGGDDPLGLGNLGGAGEAQTHTFSVRVAGRSGDGNAVEFTSETTRLAGGTELKRHLKATVRVRDVPVVSGKRNAIVVEAHVAVPGWWVYGLQGSHEGSPMTATLVPAPGAAPEALWNGGGPVSPPGKKYPAPEPFSFEIPFVPLRAGPLAARVAFDWSACDKNICDPNEIDYVPVSFDVAPGAGAVERIEAPADQDDLARKSLLQLLVLAIGGGLFALAMPCTYPLIPITISFFTKQAEQRDGRVAGLAFAYGAGIVAVFVAVGVIFGQPILKFAALPAVNAVFALLFLVFGLSLVGLFAIRLPGFFNDIATRASGTGGYLSVFAMGTTLVITSFTCTAPIVGLVLVFAAKGGSLWTVGYTMGIFGLTMAIPFVFLSLSPRAMQSMPRSGEWMKTLKVTLGIVELGLVLKFLSNMDLGLGTNLIGRELFLVLWDVSFLVAALYVLGVFDLLRRGAKWSVGKGRAVCGLVLLAVTAYLARGVDGTLLAENLEAFLPALPSDDQAYHAGFLDVVEEDYARGLEVARKYGAPVFLHFTGYL